MTPRQIRRARRILRRSRIRRLLGLPRCPLDRVVLEARADSLLTRAMWAELDLRPWRARWLGLRADFLFWWASL